MKPFSLILLFPLVLLCFQAKAQYYDSGQDPVSIKWRQMNTEAFQIIFPDFYEPQAMRLAQHLDSIVKVTGLSLPGKIKKMPLILHTQSAIANGLVVWAPKRMEWWTSAPQEMELLPWFEQLGLHEYRHVLQTQNVVDGLSGVLASIFGEHITGAIVGLFIPKWFLEGDATVSETALSMVGRGRSGSFQMEYRAQLLEKGSFSYDKATFGSYKEYVPSIYHLGYYLTAYGRKEFGVSIWEDGLRNVARKPWQLNPFERTIKKYSGQNMNHFYRSAMDYYDSLWRKDYPSASLSSVTQRLTEETKVYTSYLNPRYSNDSTILVLKSGLELVTAFTEISTKTCCQKKIRKTGNINTNFFDYHNGNIVWAEIKRHQRWQQSVYTNIVELNVEQQKRQNLTKKTRYYSPTYAHDGSRIVAVADNELNQQSIVLLDVSNHQILHQSIPVFNNNWTYPCFSQTGHSVFVVGVNTHGRGIYEYEPDSRKFSLVKNFHYTNVSHLQQKGDFIFCIADFSGIAQVYALHLVSKEVFQLTEALFGVTGFDISPTLTEIVYSSYSSKGHYLEKKTIQLTPVALHADVKNYPIAEKLSKEENIQVSIDFSQIYSTYPVKKYPKWKHLLNFHSWSPVAIDPAQQQISTGASVMSQNILSTSFLEAGLLWNSEEERGALYFDYTYKGFYPIITTSLNYKGRQTKRNGQSITWSEFIWGTRIRFPFSFNKENHYYGLSPSIYYEYKQIFPHENYTSPIRENQIVSLGLFLYNQEQRAPKFIYPRWAQDLTLNINKSFNSGADSWLFSAYGRGFFPGILSTHNLNFYSGYQYNQEGDIIFSNQITLARGYTNIIAENLFSNKVNYTFPIVYPDWALSRVLYFKRIYTNAFYDFMWYTNSSKEYVYNYSLGAELYFDINAFRFDTPINTGVRVSYLVNMHNVAFDFLFGFVF